VGGGDECWLWIATIDRTSGYGKIMVEGRPVGAHRVSWELANGRAIPKGISILHSCDNPPCVNPSHLSAGTPKENFEDMVRKNRQPWDIVRDMAEPKKRLLRIPRELDARLEKAAEAEGTSVNGFITAVLAAAVDYRKPPYLKPKK